MGAAVVERVSRAGNDLAHRPGDENLVRSGKGEQSRADVHGDAAVLAAGRLELTCVHGGAYAQPQRVHGCHGGRGAADGVRRTLEDCEEAVARGVDLAAVMALELRPNRRV